MSKVDRRAKRAKRRHDRSKEIKWDKLDNTAHLFPVIAGIGFSNVYRISMVLKEEIKRELLQQALDETLPLFPVFNSRLQQGMFWYYFEENGKKAPKVVEESTYPCQYIEDTANRNYLFRVTYYKCRINLEVFHVLTDGMGGMQFLRELTYKYLRLAHPDLMTKMGDGLSPETSLDTSDSYIKNYEKSAGKPYKSEEAYQLTGPSFERGKIGVIHGHLSVSQVKKKAKEYQASINEYLIASLFWSIYTEKLQKQPGNKPISASVPVNLRPYFNSMTTKNFFAMARAEFHPERCDHTFREVLQSVQTSLRGQLNRDYLEEVISYNVSNEKKMMLRAVPLFLKKVAMRYVYNNSVKANTTTITNVGGLTVLEEYQSYIENYVAYISRSKRQDLKCSLSSYGDKLNVVVTSILKDTSVQKGLFSFLASEGIDVTIETNGVFNR